MSRRLDGKVAFISGAARGQGRAHALRLAGKGADIIAFDVCAPVPGQASSAATETDLADTAAAVKDLDRRIVTAVVDSRDREAVQQCLSAGVDALGTVDIVVANAGVTPPGAMAHELGPDEWQGVLDTNLTGVYNTATAAVPTMIEQGHGGAIVLTSSSLGLRPVHGLAGYASAKAALVALMRTMAIELGPHGIRVNTVHPTAVGTEMLLNDANYQMFRPDLEHPTQEDALPMYRSLHVLPVAWIDAEDISNAVLYLVSDEGRYVTGSTLAVDAGMTIK